MPRRSPLFPYTTLFRSQAPIDPRHEQGQQKVARVEVYWRAVTYKTVVGYSCLGVAILFGGFYLAKPDWYSFVYKKFRSEEHTSELQSRFDLVCRLLLEK